MIDLSLQELGAEWRAACLMYPLYAALGREFVIDLPPCSELEAPSDVPEREAIENARHWFAAVDEHVHVHQLRQFLQMTTLSSPELLQTLLVHHLRKEPRTPADRDKIDFLLVQFFSHTVPSRLDDADVDLEYVAQVLEPVLGKADMTLPAWLAPLEEMLHAAQRSDGLNQLLQSGILERGRELKVQCGEEYFQPAALAAFTRFSFLMRRIFFRRMHEDLNAILDGLRDLERNGIAAIDCRRAQFSNQEPTGRLRMVCQSWKVLFQAEYSSGQPMKMLVDLRAAVDEALASAQSGKMSAATPAVAKGSAAPAFEISVETPAWDPDAPKE